MAIPAALVNTHSRWTKAGRPRQVASRWNAESWAGQLPEYQAFLESLGTNQLDRQQAIRRIGPITTETEAVHAFLLAMLWGHGPVGYGAFRTARILDEPGAKKALREVAGCAQKDGGLAAFDYISERRKKDHGYLKGLGPAFGTKYLYFVSAAVAPGEATPVMDAIVRRWFLKNAPKHRLVVDDWHPPSYKTY